MFMYVVKVMWDCMSENISVTTNLAYAMRNALVWLTPYIRINKIDYSFNNIVWIYTDDKTIVIERFMVNDMLEKY